jgi:hypothetical protein
MTADAIALLVVAIVIVWGGLAVSAVFLVRRPEVGTWPPGDPDPDDEESPTGID